jgi:predicted  nucleic acid-binding Zn-ribbon protein
MSQALTALKTAADIGKIISNANSSMQDAETKLRIAQLIEELAVAKINIASIQELLQSKDEEIKELKEKLMMHKSLVFQKPFYWNTDKVEKEGPYCSNCWETVKKQVHLIRSGSTSLWDCPHCKNRYDETGGSVSVKNGSIKISRG